VCGQNVRLLSVKLAVRAVITVNVDDKRLKYLAFELEFKMYNSYRIALHYINSKYSRN
jgi:membrane protein CcdC involved in cytochrome C biogenesis